MNNSKNVVIIGAGGFGREVAWIIERINKQKPIWNLIGFADDNINKGTEIGRNIVKYTIDDIKNIQEPINVIIAIGNSVIRKKVYEKIKDNKNIIFPNIIDPDAVLGIAELGYGNIICAKTIATVDIKIKNFTIINLDCTIGHDDILEDFVTIYPSVNVSGNVTVGECTEIGTGTKIIQQKQICKNCIIGAGAVVVKNIEEEGTYVGVPAKRLEKN